MVVTRGALSSVDVQIPNPSAYCRPHVWTGFGSIALLATFTLHKVSSSNFLLEEIRRVILLGQTSPNICPMKF